MAYTDAIRLFYKGDRQKAARYVNDARRLAFFLVRQLNEAGVSSGRRRHRLQNGTVIVDIIVAGKQVTAVIDVATPKKRLPRDFDDFVVFARTPGLPDGIAEEYPQQILRPPAEDEAVWRTYFFNADTTEYENHTRPKGTYRSNTDGTPLFPEGIEHAGMIDWRGPDGERLSWYGPTSRYWYDAYRQPTAQYGKFVFYMGQVLLDVDQYCTDNDVDFGERYVTGAFIREHEDGRWLYVILSPFTDMTTDTSNLPPFTIRFQVNFPNYNVNIRVRRFRLVEDTETTEAVKWSVQAGSHESLFFGTSARAVNPWFFNESGTKGTTFSLPSNPIVYMEGREELENVAPFPPEANQRIDFMIDEAGVVSFNVETPSLLAGPGQALLAVDYGEDDVEIPIYLERAPYQLSPNAIHLRIDGWRLPLWYKTTNIQDGFDARSIRNVIGWLDARSQAAVIYRAGQSWTERPEPPNNALLTWEMEFYVDGQLQQSHFFSQNASSADNAVQVRDLPAGILDSVAGRATAPMFWMYIQMGIYELTDLFYFSYAGISGLSASNWRLPFHPDETFGSFGISEDVAVPPTVVVPDVSTAAFGNTPQDVHGYRTPFGAAAYKGFMVWSGYAAHEASSSADYPQASYITRDSLSSATSVGGSGQRYHPIWLIGKPIGGDNPPV